MSSASVPPQDVHPQFARTRVPNVIRTLEPGETRAPEELYKHYLIERELADRLRASAKQDRSFLYSQLYNELFQRLPNHPQLTRVQNAPRMSTIVQGRVNLLSRFLKPDSVYLEVGAGDCRVPMEVARQVRKAYAVDVSDEVNRGITPPPNFELILSNGTDIPLPDNSVDVAFSYQLMEHIHPEDAADQLRSIHRVLTPGGVYMCVTPNRLNGPHDISRYFEKEATGFHLKEYTIGELRDLFKGVGFRTVFPYSGGRSRYVKLPLTPVVAFESLFAALPWSLRVSLGELRIVRGVLEAAVVAVK